MAPISRKGQTALEYLLIVVVAIIVVVAVMLWMTSTSSRTTAGGTTQVNKALCSTHTCLTAANCIVAPASTDCGTVAANVQCVGANTVVVPNVRGVCQYLL